MLGSEDENDSRTASVGMQRNQIQGSNNSSRRSSQERSRKKQKRIGDRDVKDFVPRGATFSANPLAIDPESTPSSDGTSSDREGSVNAGDKSTEPAQHIGIGENKEQMEQSSSGEGVGKTAQGKFDAVNDRYWRSRSASGSSDEDTSSDGGDSDDSDDDTSGSDSSPLSDDTGDSDSLGSEENDDSIMVNVDSLQHSLNGDPSADGSGYDPESRRVIEEGLLNGSASDGNAKDSSVRESKEEALRRFSQKYSTPPSSLVDLDRHDFEIQAKYLFFDRDINDINLSSPIGCTECLREGHLAEVCPSKECVHCGAWNQHQSSLCPSWRRCQKCRERGHGEEQCSHIFTNDVSHVPCDFCSSPDHIESECDQLWKFPQKDPNPGPVLVSISCANCTSNRHLIGDCPSLRRPIRSSSWTLKGFDPDMISNLNSVISGRRGGNASRGQHGMKIRGRAEHRSPSPSSDEFPIRPRQPIGRGGRPNIQIGRIGRGRGGSQAPPLDSRIYRDRQDHPGNNTRQRSLSPNAYPIRGRSMDSWKPPPPRARGNGDRGGRGRGRGGSKRGGNGDSYRPLPSAAKKNWDRFRL